MAAGYKCAESPRVGRVPRPNSFVIITANRVIHCNTDMAEEMHHWISLLQKPKGDSRVDGQEFLVRGQCIWLLCCSTTMCRILDADWSMTIPRVCTISHF